MLAGSPLPIRSTNQRPSERAAVAFGERGRNAGPLSLGSGNQDFQLPHNPTTHGWPIHDGSIVMSGEHQPYFTGTFNNSPTAIGRPVNRAENTSPVK